jgi:epsilon-lactone hydrolase
VRVHRKLREAGVVADLLVFEGLSHAQYLFDPDAPESKQHFVETAAFFDKYLENSPGRCAPCAWVSVHEGRQ